MNDKVKEVYNSLQERLKSPFLLTFIMVWTVKHWRLILIVLNFKDSEGADSKQQQIERYISEQSLTIYKWDLPNWAGMVLPVLFWSILSIIFYYVITITTETISIWYKRVKSRVMLFLNEHRAIVTKQEYDNEVSKSNRLQVRNETLTKRMGELEQQYNLEKKAVDSSVEKLRVELLALTDENKATKIENFNQASTLKSKEIEIEQLNNQRIKLEEAFMERIKETEKKNIQNEKNLNNTILSLQNKVKLTETLLKNYDEDFTKSSNSSEIDLLRRIFSYDKWEITTTIGDNIIVDNAKLTNDYFLYDTGEILFISQVKLRGKILTFILSKVKGKPTGHELENMYMLDTTNTNLLAGMMGGGDEVSYKRI